MSRIAYIVIEEDNQLKLSIKVTEYSRDGWNLVGGVSVSNYLSSDGEVIWNYAQAMAREPIDLHLNYFPGRIE